LLRSDYFGRFGNVFTWRRGGVDAGPGARCGHLGIPLTSNFGKTVYNGNIDYYLESSPTPPRSAHSSGHNGSGYDGCASCHSTHGANIIVDSMTDQGTYILKNDPARGVTSNAEVPAEYGYTDASGTLHRGYGAFIEPVENQRDFCLDCHNGIARYAKSPSGVWAKVVDLDTQQALAEVFPSCASDPACHTAFSGSMGAQLGVEAVASRDGRSHVMTTQMYNESGQRIAWSVTQKTINIPGVGTFPYEGNTRGTNSCTLCHTATDQWPHYSANNHDFITSYSDPGSLDKVCMRCHAGPDGQYGTNDGGVGEGF
jgi:hypothetical protein